MPATLEEPAVRLWSRDLLAKDLENIGVRPGDVLLVQSSLRSIGPLDGGPGVLVDALLDVLGCRGTLVVYTASPENSDTSRVARARVAGLTAAELRAHRDAMPAYDPATTPSSPSLGRFSEEVRARPGAVRSGHPQTSFTALGHDAAELMAEHALSSHLGPGSPVQKLYDRGARALLIGVPLWCCTAFHLAEYRQDDPPRQTYGCVVTDAHGVREWRHFEAIRLDDDYFDDLAPVLAERLAGLSTGALGQAKAHLLEIAEGVEVTTEFLRTRRTGLM